MIENPKLQNEVRPSLMDMSGEHVYKLRGVFKAYLQVWFMTSLESF